MVIVATFKLGYPLPNGLYDGRMGPIDFHDRCEYCRMYGKFCPGHFGYIHLDVPTFNPVLFPFLYNVGPCFLTTMTYFV